MACRQRRQHVGKPPTWRRRSGDFLAILRVVFFINLFISPKNCKSPLFERFLAILTQNSEFRREQVLKKKSSLPSGDELRGHPEDVFGHQRLGMDDPFALGRVNTPSRVESQRQAMGCEPSAENGPPATAVDTGQQTSRAPELEDIVDEQLRRCSLHSECTGRSTWLGA